MKKVVTKNSDLFREMAQAFPITAKVHKAEDGGYWVESPALGGCFSAGETLGQALHNFKFAVFEYFDIPKKFQKAESFSIQSIEIPEPKSIKRSAPVTLVPSEPFLVA